MRKLFVLRGVPACVDRDTEYFNGTEWKSIADYKDGEKVLQYNEDGTANLVEPIKYHKIECTDGFYKIKNNQGTVDQVVSPDHNIAYLSSKGNLNKIVARELVERHNNKTGGFYGRFINHFKLLSDYLVDENRLRLMIAISADGSLEKSGTRWRVRIFKEYKIKRLRELLQANNLTIDERVYQDNSHNFFIPVEYGIKIFPKEFYLLSPKCRDVFIDEIFRWDGDCKKTYRTTIKENANIAQFILSQYGYRVSTYIYNRINRQKGNYTIKSACYTITITTQKYTGIRKKGRDNDIVITKIPSIDGYQYCFTVPSGYLVLRRNNIITVTGNCGKSTWIRENKLQQYTLSSDDIRLMMASPDMDNTGHYKITQKNDGAVWELLFKLLEGRMKRGELVIVDATHYKQSLLQPYKELAKKYRYRLYVIDFTDVSLEDLIQRNSLRDEYKQVPQEVIEQMYKVITSDKEVLGRFKILTKDEALAEIRENWIRDCNEYKAITVFGDIHGCYMPLEKYFKEHEFNKDTLYVFTGDYLDRGIQNKEVLEFMLSIYKEDNVICLEGNHEAHLRQYCQKDYRPFEFKDDYERIVIKKYFGNKGVKELNKNSIKSKEFLNNTIPQIQDIDRKELRQFCDRLCQIAILNFNGKNYVITHGGLSNLPTPMTTTQQLIDGTGDYSDLHRTYEAWLKNTTDYWVQIHAHRNVQEYGVFTDTSRRIVNLCDTIEFGGYLRTVTITKDGIDAHLIRNLVFKPMKKKEEKDTVGDIFTELSENKWINKKHLFGDVYSFNFTRDAFKKDKWNEQTIKARGLFVDMEERKVVCRGYDKFFGYMENRETTPIGISTNTEPTYYAWKKYNGFLGLVSLYKDKLLVCSKSTNEGPYAQMLRDTLVETLGRNGVKELKKYLRRGDRTCIFECIHLNDPHIIKYNKNEVVLLDIVENNLEDIFYGYGDIELLSKKLGCRCKTYDRVLTSKKDLFEWIDNEALNCMKEVEGWVIEDRTGFRFKIKTKFYKFWKQMRTVLETLKRGAEVKKEFISREGINVIQFMQTFTREELQEMSIIDIRDKFIEACITTV